MIRRCPHRNGILAAVYIIVVTAACSSGNEATIITTTAAPTTAPTTTVDRTTDDISDFCVVGARVMQAQGTASLNDFSPQYFDEADSDFAELLAAAPGDLSGAIEDLRAGFVTTAQIYEQFGFDVSAPGFVDALTEGLDNASMVDAVELIGQFIDRNCTDAEIAAGQAPGGYSFDRSDPALGPLNIQALAPELTQETAQCIYDAWGDISKIPPEELTQELMVHPICGTSIFELLTGDDRFSGDDAPDS
jgi:hypothetical protein